MLTIKHHHHQDLDQFHLIPPLQSLKAVNFCINFQISIFENVLPAAEEDEDDDDYLR